MSVTRRLARVACLGIAVLGLSAFVPGFPPGIAAGLAQAGEVGTGRAKPAAGLFGSVEFIGGSLAALSQWTRVLERIATEKEAYAACDADVRQCESPAIAAWRAKKRSVDGLPPREQLREINRFLNTWPYRTDRENYGVSDYWASPLKFIDRSGDCEDYAIIKYVTLLELGFAVEEMRIVVVQDVLRDLPHAVLAVRVEGRTLILDSLFDAVLPHTEITFYVPHYSVNETTRWAHLMPTRTSQPTP